MRVVQGTFLASPECMTADSTGRVRTVCAGFTFVELLLVVVLVGVLAAIAIPFMATYRVRAFDGRAIHDLANAVRAEEAHYATFKTYVAFTAVGPVLVSVPETAVSDTVTVEFQGNATWFQGTSTSSRGSGKIFAYDSLSDTIVGN
jgi:type IV pilus assembly protein PilA